MIKNVCCAKDSVKRLKRQAAAWEKVVFVNPKKDLYLEYMSIKNTLNSIVRKQKIKFANGQKM